MKTAQQLGYAEADPSADVEGWDARSKLCILARLAFGVTVGVCIIRLASVACVFDLHACHACTTCMNHNVDVNLRQLFLLLLGADESAVPCQGISKIESVDFEYGKLMNHTIKLLGIAEEIDEEPEQEMTNGIANSKPREVALSVCPVMVSCFIL